MFRAYQMNFTTRLSPTATTGSIFITPEIDSMEWDIYQISVQTQQQNDACQALIFLNGFFLCGTNQGYLDCATGPPDVVVGGKDKLQIEWIGTNPGDIVQCGIWYNENPTGTTYSSAH